MSSSCNGSMTIQRATELLPKVVKEYKLDGDRSADQEFLLRHADQEKAWPMDKVSNAPFTEVTHTVASMRHLLINPTTRRKSSRNSNPPWNSRMCPSLLDENLKSRVHR